MKVGIVGSREYQDYNAIKDFIADLKSKYGKDLEIISGGQPLGADGFAKKACIELKISKRYREFPPYHFKWNKYCVEPKYMFNKDYKVWYYFQRNKKIAEYSDIVVGFIPAGHISKGTNDTLEKAEKLEKKTLIIN